MDVVILVEQHRGKRAKTHPGSYSVRVLECADVGERKRRGGSGDDGGLRVGAGRPDRSSIFVPLIP